MSIKKLTVAICAFSLATLNGTQVSAQAPAKPDSELMKKGEDLYSKMRLKEAAETYREVIRLEPDNDKAHQRLGAVLAGMEDYETAILEEKTAAKLNPKNFLPHVILGQIYANQAGGDPKKMQEALKEFEIAVELKPTSFKARLDLGFAQAQLGQVEKAIETYKKADEIDQEKVKKGNEPQRDATPLLNVGVLLAQQLKYKEAIAAEEEALKINKNVPAIYINLGNIYAESGDNDKAVKAFEDAIKLIPARKTPVNFIPSLANAHSGLGWVLQKKGNYSAAIAEQRKALKVAPDFGAARRRLAKALADNGEAIEAEKEYERSVKDGPKDVTTHVEYAQFLKKMGKKDQAVQHLKTALEINPESKIAKEELSKVNTN